MKKIIPALLLVLCLICGIAVAETGTKANELNWSDYEETMKTNLHGHIEEMENYTFKYYLPDAFTKTDKEGYEFYYTSSDGYVYAAKVVKFEEDALDAYYQSLLKDASFSNVVKATVNGYNAVIYKLVDEVSTACCSIEVEGGSLMTFYFAPANTDDDFIFATAFFAGIQ